MSIREDRRGLQMWIRVVGDKVNGTGQCNRGQTMSWKGLTYIEEGDVESALLLSRGTQSEGIRVRHVLTHQSGVHLDLPAALEQLAYICERAESHAMQELMRYRKAKEVAQRALSALPWNYKHGLPEAEEHKS